MHLRRRLSSRAPNSPFFPFEFIPISQKRINVFPFQSEFIAAELIESELKKKRPVYDVFNADLLILFLKMRFSVEIKIMKSICENNLCKRQLNRTTGLIAISMFIFLNFHSISFRRFGLT